MQRETKTDLLAKLARVQQNSWHIENFNDCVYDLASIIASVIEALPTEPA